MGAPSTESDKHGKYKNNSFQSSVYCVEPILEAPDDAAHRLEPQESISKRSCARPQTLVLRHSDCTTEAKRALEQNLSPQNVVRLHHALKS